MIRLERYNGINRTPALKLLMRAHLALLDAELGDNVVGIFWDDMAIVAFDDDFPVGVISYRHYDHLKEVNVVIGWVS